jgi:beta-phosphoglucomutase-like phosphatase (HAD superfamily)
MFDIDGTLTDTVKVDKECFVRSLAEACGFFDIETDWSRYEHATDAGIFLEIHEARTGRPPSVAEVSTFSPALR